MSVTKKSPHAKLARLAEGVLGRSVARIEKPGGSRRQSCRLVLDDDERVIATRRDELSQAVLEVRVLKLLADNDAPVPSVLASRGDFLVQSHLDGPRLSQALDGAGPATVERLLDDGLASLTRLHQTGSALGLDESVPRRGHKRGWIEGLIERPAVFSRVFDLEPPDLPHEDLIRLFSVERPRFVKWDARPANAILTEGGVAWFDFEDCGARRRLDDLIWLLADEFTPDLIDVEARLLEKHLPVFADGLAVEEAHRYVHAYGAFHILVRLGLILKRKGDGSWWAHDYCLERDKAGVTRACAMRLCLRAARWSSEVVELQPLARWFVALAERIPPEDAAEAAAKLRLRRLDA